MYIDRALVATDIDKGSIDVQVSADTIIDWLEKYDRELAELANRTWQGRRAAALWFATECDAIGGSVPLLLLLKGQRNLLVQMLCSLESDLIVVEPVPET